VVHLRPGQGTSRFGETMLPQKPKIGRVGHWEVLFRVYILTHNVCHATDVPFLEYHAACGRRLACVDIGQSALAYLCLISLISRFLHLRPVVTEATPRDLCALKAPCAQCSTLMVRECIFSKYDVY